MAEKSDLEKLQIMLAHWIEHNHNHAEEMAKWQKVAEASKLSEAAALITKAISCITDTDNALSAALKKLGGAPQGHHHH